MALIILESPTGEVPKQGCGLIVKAEEDNFVLAAGTASEVSISFELGAALTAGDEMELHGVKFTFVAGVPTNLNEIRITPPTTYVNVRDRLAARPDFSLEYDLVLDAPNRAVVITNKVAKFDERFGYNFTVANANAIQITPATTPDQGSNADILEEYVAFGYLYDENGDPLICKPLSAALNVDSNLDTHLCMSFEDIICSLEKPSTALPLPRQSVPQGGQFPTNFDENYLLEVTVNLYPEYRNPDGTEKCDRILGINDGVTFTAANMIQPKDYQATLNYFRDLFRHTVFGGEQRFITIMPESYKICKYTPFELRYFLQADFIVNSLGGICTLEVVCHYQDGTSELRAYNLEDARDGIHVANISCDENGSPTFPNSTIGYPSYNTKTPVRLAIRVYYTIAAVEYNAYSRDVFIDNENNGKCCGGCVKTFYFLSSVGNNEVLEARCESDIDVEVEFYGTCREVACEGEDTFGVKQFNGGKIPAKLSKKEKVYKVWFSEDPDYIEAFVSAPVKYVYEGNNVYRIYPTATSYKTFTKNNRTITEFTYYKSLVSLEKQLEK